MIKGSKIEKGEMTRNLANNFGSSGFLPSRIIAHEKLSQLLTPKGSFEDAVHVRAKKPPKRTTTPPTSPPPIVWFPGEPDCNESATSSNSLWIISISSYIVNVVFLSFFKKVTCNICNFGE